MPEIIVTSGNIFESGCEALVNPVDAVTGAQGKGLAAAFKRRYPATCAVYRDFACRSGSAQPGGIWCAKADVWLVFAATKDHWRSPSRLEWVRCCLDRIVDWTEVEQIDSIAIPALGCGLGRADWAAVRPMILDTAKRMTCDVVKVYEPR